jgi:hypothetical protein
MNPNKTYIIQNIETKELFTARSGKTSWKQPGHAKNAWNQSFYSAVKVERAGMEMIPAPARYDKSRMRVPLFSEQSIFEVVELKHESSGHLDDAISLLTSCLGRVDFEVNQEILDFLSSVKK